VAPQECDRAGPTPGSGANRTAPSSEGEGRVKTLSSPPQGPPAGAPRGPAGFGVKSVVIGKPKSIEKNDKAPTLIPIKLYKPDVLRMVSCRKESPDAARRTLRNHSQTTKTGAFKPKTSNRRR
jgi:hypothetical protein